MGLDDEESRGFRWNSLVQEMLCSRGACPRLEGDTI
jgi:hypothetical protein